jgi:hypothetical protein
MKFVSSLAVAASLIAGGLAAAPASALAPAAQAAAPQQRKFDISKAAQKPLSELQAAVKGDAAVFAEKLAAAQAVATTKDDKYLIAKFRLNRALDIKDQAEQEAAIQAVMASGAADATELANMNKVLISRALNAKDYARAEGMLATYLAANPNDLDQTINFASTKIELNKPKEALPLLQRAMQLSTAAGQQPPESWYRSAVKAAYDAKDYPTALSLSRQTLERFPNDANFKNALTIYGVSARNLDKETELDLLRLKRATKTMNGAHDYGQLAFLVDQKGYPGEAKAVLEEGTRLGIVQPGTVSALLAAASSRTTEDRASLAGLEPKAKAAANGTLALNTATAYAGYGDYAKAAELYRVALAKGGVDANLVNTRLGAALALAGQKAEAQAAFKAVTGPRVDIAALWLAWLATH